MDCTKALCRAPGLVLVMAAASFFQPVAYSQTSLLHIQVQVNRLDGDPVSGLRGRDFFLSDGSGRLPVTVVRPSLSRKPAELPAMRIMMIFPSIAGFADAAEISRLLASSLTDSFGKAEIAVMRADGSMTPYASSRADLIASVGVRGRLPPNIFESFEQLGKYPGRRAVVYFVGAYQSVPPGVVAAARRVCALVYQVGKSSEPIGPFSNEPSPGGLPLTGGAVTFDPSIEPHVGFPVLSAGYAQLPMEIAGGVRVERTPQDTFKRIVKDGQGFYDVRFVVLGTRTKLRLGLVHGEDYAMEAQPYTLGTSKVPELSIERPARFGR